MTTTPNDLKLLPGHIRVGDADRAALSERLSAHAAAGRLTLEELEQRLELAHRAVVVSELRALETDLAPPVQERGVMPWPPLLAIAAALLVAGVVGSFAVGFPIPPVFIGAFLLWRLAAWRRGSGPAYTRIAPR